mmetsp:Transcript_55241/g.135271  ORF Transcript_55241/g.135271 Transcript_55241/m.135271 type:complete len:220 (+) Transcript_55241:354-1013(+)
MQGGIADFSEVATGAADFILGGEDEAGIDQGFAAAGGGEGWTVPSQPIDANWAAGGGWSSVQAASWDGNGKGPGQVNYAAAFSSAGDGGFGGQFNTPPLGLHFIPMGQQPVWSDSSSSIPNSNIAAAFGAASLQDGGGAQWSQMPSWSAQPQQQQQQPQAAPSEQKVQPPSVPCAGMPRHHHPMHTTSNRTKTRQMVRERITRRLQAIGGDSQSNQTQS